ACSVRLVLRQDLGECLTRSRPSSIETKLLQPLSEVTHREPRTVAASRALLRLAVVGALVEELASSPSGCVGAEHRAGDSVELAELQALLPEEAALNLRRSLRDGVLRSGTVNRPEAGGSALLELGLRELPDVAHRGRTLGSAVQCRCPFEGVCQRSDS